MFLLMLAELRTLITRHARPDETTAIDGVLVSAATRPGEPRASTTGTVMAIIAQGAKRLAIGDRVYDYGPGQYLVASVDLPITGHYTQASPEEPALGFGLVLRPSAIAPLLLEGAVRAAPAPIRARRRRRHARAASTRSCACCACSTPPPIRPCSRRCSSARSCGG